MTKLNKIIKQNKKLEPTLIIIDMQEEFLKNFTQEQRKELINEQINIIKESINLGIPILTFEYINSGNTINQIKEITNKIESHQTLIKPNNSIFTNKDTIKILNKWKINTIILTGINATSCIYETIEDALKNKIQIITSKTLIANPQIWMNKSKTDKVHNKSVQNLNTKLNWIYENSIII